MKWGRTSDIRLFLHVSELLSLSKPLAMKPLTYATDKILISPAHTAALTILFRHKQTADVQSASEKWWLHTTFWLSILGVCSLYGTPRLSAHG
jgi:hypothetical protein